KPGIASVCADSARACEASGRCDGLSGTLISWKEGLSDEVRVALDAGAFARWRFKGPGRRGEARLIQRSARPVSARSRRSPGYVPDQGRRCQANPGAAWWGRQRPGQRAVQHGAWPRRYLDIDNATGGTGLSLLLADR